MLPLCQIHSSWWTYVSTESSIEISGNVYSYEYTAVKKIYIRSLYSITSLKFAKNRSHALASVNRDNQASTGG
jgi:hypothetical protein